MKYHFLLPLLLTLALLHSCKEEPCHPDLPCPTQGGLKIFGCYIDGKPWVAEKAPYIWDPSVHELTANYDETDYGPIPMFNKNHIDMTATRVDSFAYEFISLHFDAKEAGSIWHQDSDLFGISFFLGPESDAKVYILDTLKPYEIVLTKLDEDKNIVSGNFSCIAFTKDRKDSIVVTEGRFDTKYSQF